MCGIAGIVARTPIAGLGRVLDGFSSSLVHRGPDDRGFLTWSGSGAFAAGRDAGALPDGAVGFTHRRLSIIDLSEAGWQPMIDAAGDSAMLFNGEIFNYRELRDTLRQRGLTFHTESDTEVLQALVGLDGAAGLSRTIGMFAFARLDRRRGTLLLARDPFGIKPLYYAVGPDRFAFASEIRALLTLDFVGRRANPAAVFRYLRQAETDGSGETLFADIRELPPAHAVELSLDAPQSPHIFRYWTPSRRSLPAKLDERALRLRELFLHSVVLHRRADVPVAATLSGGIDSSGIVAALRQQEPQTPLAAFSFLADDPAVAEERWARLVADATGAALRPVRLNPDKLATDLDRLIQTQEQPFTTSSMWAQAEVFRAVHEAGFKVALDGQGADEMFAGYPVFRAAYAAGLLRQGRLGEAQRLLRAAPGGSLPLGLQALATFLPGAARPLLRRLAGKPVLPDWMQAGWFAAVPMNDMARGSLTSLQADLARSRERTSLPMLLRYADRNAMAVSVENRVPFLTPDLAEFALSVPDSDLIDDAGTTKAILRRALRGLVPDAVLDRRDKIGFVTPEAKWFAASPALRAMLERAASALPACFTPAAAERLRAVAAGRATHDGATWRIFNLTRWAELLRVELA